MDDRSRNKRRMSAHPLPSALGFYSNRPKLSASVDERTVAFSPTLAPAGMRIGRMHASFSTAEDGGGHV